MTRSLIKEGRLSGEDVMEHLVDGALAFRAEMGIEEPPDKAALAAVWQWTLRAKDSDDEVESACLHNVLDGLMWVDWQGGEIVFRMTPEGIAHVEELAGGSDVKSIETLMGSMGLTVPDRPARRES